MGVLAVVLLAAGCGKTDDQPVRFNETLGDTAAGAPVTVSPVDTGILKDPASYQPASFVPLEGEAAFAGGAEGEDAEAISNVISGLVDAVFHLEFDTALDAFVPDQVAALAEEDEYLQSFDDLKTALDSLLEVAASKAPEADSEDSPEPEELLRDLNELLANAMTISVVDEEHAVATFHLDRVEIPEQYKPKVAQAMQFAAAAMAQLGQAGAGSPFGGFTPDMLDDLPSVELPLPMSKVDDAWRFELPFTIEDQHAELISEVAMIFTDLSRDFAQAVAEVETLDEQTAIQIGTQVSGRHVPALMGWFARAKLAFASLMESGAQGEEESAETSGDEAGPAESEEEPPEPPPTGRAGRGRRP